MALAKIRLPLGARSYDILVGKGAIGKFGTALKRKNRRGFLISDRALTEPRAKTMAALKKCGWDIHEIAVEAGEGLKNFDSVLPLFGELLKAGADRDATLFALGGGTVGDAAGFVAATYLRGISWVGIPTTLLAQVDSSVGGKTGINHPTGKNLIGSFYQPSLVVCDTDFLQTLSPRERISGLGETVKYGLTFDPAFFTFLETHSERFLALDERTLARSVQTSLQWKAKMVARDEFDRKGVREVLNFGHTFGHALESITSYQYFQHGEAVIWGMRFALALSLIRKRLATKTWDRLDHFLGELPVPAIPRDIPTEKIFEKMSHDKKMREGKLHFVLLDRLGHAVSDSDVKPSDLKRAYQVMESAG